MHSTLAPDALQENAEAEWSQLRLRFLDRLWLGSLVVALLAAPISISRTFYTGWEAVYAFHVTYLAAVLLGFMLRRRLSYRVRAVLLIGIMDFTAVGGIVSFGLLGSAWWWMLMAGLLAGLLFTRLVGIVHTAIGIVFLIAIAVAYTTGGLAIGFDANEYVTLPVAWATMLSGPALLTIFGFWAIGIFFDTTHAQLLELDRRRLEMAKLVEQLEISLEEVKTLHGLIPICMHCKKVRDDQGFWQNVEAFVSRHTDAKFTHALCQPCGVELYGDLWRKAMQNTELMEEGSK